MHTESFSDFPYFEKENKKGGLRDDLAVCVSPTQIVARLMFGKHVPAATNTHAPIEKVLDAVFPMRSATYQILSSNEKEVGD
jgi:hypothetical protein